ncbi:MAG: HlyC/CorC family transporter [Planctomycetes bacterium]|nr:HlyC/CorC family transporter [Planctomycetota bacterium]
MNPEIPLGNTLPEILFQIFQVFALVFLNGFFVAAEFAIVKVRITQIEALLSRGTPIARPARHVVSHLDAYLSATQLGITLASLGLGWIGEPVVSRLLEKPLSIFGIEGAALHTVSLIAGFIAITFLHIVLGELAPKSLAIQRAQTTTLVISTPLILFYFLSYPLIWVLNRTSNVILIALGLRTISEHELAYSEEELRMVLSRSSGGETTRFVRKMALHALELRQRPVREIMIPRTLVVFLDLQQLLDANLKTARDSNYTRFPLCDGGIDHAVGMVHLKDILWKLLEGREAVDLGKIRRDLLFIPETLSLENVLSQFLQKHCHMAIVLDEYGGTLGLVTLEDVLEELVGEIQDEFDQEVPLIMKLPNQEEYLADGSAPLYHINAVCGSELEGEGVDTLSGYLVKVKGKIPKESEEIQAGDFIFMIKKVGKRRILQVLIKKAAPQLPVSAPVDADQSN